MATSRNAMLALMDQLVVSGSNFLTLVMVSRKLGPEGVAKYVYAFSLILLLSMLASALIYQNIAADRAKGEFESTAGRKYAHFNAVLSLISVPICLAVYMLIAGENGLFPVVEAMWAALFIFATQSVDYHRRVAYFLGPDLPIWRPLLASIVLYIPRLIGLIVFDQDNVLEVLQWQFLLTVPGLVYFNRDLSFVQMSSSGKFYLEQIQRGRWLLMTVPINWVWGQGPVFILSLVCGNHVAGIFAAVRGVTNFANVAMEMIPTQVAAALSRKRASAESESGYYSDLKRLLVFGVGIWLIGLFIVSLWGGALLSAILGFEYRDEGRTLWILWGASLLIFLSRLQSMHVNFTGVNKVIPVIFFAGFIVLCLSFLPLRFMEQIGMAIALLIGWTFIVCLGEILRRRWRGTEA